MRRREEGLWENARLCAEDLPDDKEKPKRKRPGQKTACAICEGPVQKAAKACQNQKRSKRRTKDGELRSAAKVALVRKIIGDCSEAEPGGRREQAKDEPRNLALPLRTRLTFCLRAFMRGGFVIEGSGDR